MKLTQLVVTAICNGYFFAVTKHGGKETVYVRFNARGRVKKHQDDRITLESDKSAPKYRVKKGMTINAHIVDGNDKYRKAKIWAPLGVCLGKEPIVYKPKNSNPKAEKPKVKKETKPVVKTEVVSKKSPMPEKPFRIHSGLKGLLQSLDAEETRQVMVKVYINGKQEFYGKVNTLLLAGSEASQKALSNDQNKFVLVDTDGENIPVWPPTPKTTV